MEMSAAEPIHHQHQHLRRATPPPGPFGYPLFGLDTPYDEAPALPPGPSLLDDTESNMLNNFFTSMDASHLDSNDFWFSIGNQDKRGANFGFEWPEELPPTFEGSTTSLGTYPTITNGIHQDGMNMGKTTSHSSDVLAAASMLYQKNGLPSQEYATNQIFTENSHNLHGNNIPRMKNSYLGPRFIDGLTPGPSPKDLALFGKGFHTSKMCFDVEQQLGPEDQRRINTLRWGSDSRFSDRRYHAAAGEPSEEDRTKDLLQNLDCLESQSSAANTRPSSPIRRSFDRTAPEWASLGNANGIKSLPTSDPTQAEDGARPKKRRKSKNRIKGEDMEIDPPNGSKEPNGRQPSRGRRFSSSTDTPHRKSKTQGKTRENLTEEQKRTNHILSEQKRRNLIKQGFDDLCSLVPELHGGGFSKSTMLIQAAEWLEDLLRGNELLQNQLAELKKQSTTNMTQ